MDVLGPTCHLVQGTATLRKCGEYAAFTLESGAVSLYSSSLDIREKFEDIILPFMTEVLECKNRLGIIGMADFFF